MTEVRNYASLSSGLLARKGTAKPAMRPQGFTGFEDLGWNDMGYDAGTEPGFAAPVQEHVPSSIAALTPAPKGGRTGADDYQAEIEAEDGDDQEAVYGEVEYGVEAEADVEVEADVEAEAVFEAEAEVEAETVYEAEADVEAEYGDEAEIEQPAEIAAEVPEAAPVQDAPSVVAQQRAILEQYDGVEELEELAEAPVPVEQPRRAARAQVVALPRRAAVAGVRKAAFTLRLDADRHLRLRLACAVTGQSAQQIVTDALDAALSEIPEIEALARRVPAKAGSAGAKRN